MACNNMSHLAPKTTGSLSLFAKMQRLSARYARPPSRIRWRTLTTSFASRWKASSFTVNSSTKRSRPDL
jgi:hypothetical protein